MCLMKTSPHGSPLARGLRAARGYQAPRHDRNSPSRLRGRVTKGNGPSPGNSPTRARALEGKAVVTKVKKVTNYEGGRMESLLVPFLVTASMMASPKRKPAAVEEDLAAPATGDEVIGHVQGIPIVIKQDPEHDDVFAPGWSRARPAAPTGLGGCNYRGPNKDLDEGSKRFIATLLHALHCSSCDDTGCKKMRLVIGHFLSCRKTSTSASTPCLVCSQLLDIVGKHAEGCDAAAGCPVPMCDVIRADRGEAEEEEMRAQRVKVKQEVACG